MREELVVLAGRYRQARTTGTLDDLYRRTVERKEHSVLDAIAAAAALGPMALADQIDLDAITPQMREAFSLQYPNLPLESLTDMSREQLQGIVSGWKGKYFEVLVRDRLEEGLPVGDLHLGPGQSAVLAGSPTQPGWDLQIIDDHAGVLSEVQLKATESLEYAKAALERYPDIPVLTTEEAVRGYVGDMIHGAGVSDETLEQAVEAPLTDLLDGALEDLIENVLPFLPFVIIALGEGRHVVAGRKTFRDALMHAGDRAAKTGAALLVGIIVYALDGGILSIPATALTRLGIDRIQALSRAVRVVEMRLLQAETLGAKYAY